MSAQPREAEVKIPHVQKTPTGWRYRRRIVPQTLAKAIGKAEWKSPIYQSLAEATAAAERLTPMHDELIRRWKAGEAYEPGDESSAAIEARARELAAMRPEAQKGAVVEMMAEAFNAWAAVGARGDMELRPEDRAALTALEGDGRHRPRVMPLTKAYARDLKEYGGKRDEKFIKFAVDKFVAWVGDRDFFDLKRADVELWIKKAKASGWAPGTV